MFSRSDKTDEAGDEFFAEEPKQRSPLVLAAFAGLLAIAGAFLLIRYLSDVEEVPVAAPDSVEATQQVLVVTQPIPAGTDVKDILAAPASYLSARAVPEQFVATSAITSIDELREMEHLTLSADALAGEQLLRGRFIDRSDFQNESFIERAAAVEAPDGHHTIVLNLPAAKALGGNVRPGDEVAVISAFRVVIPEVEPFDISVMVLPTIEVVGVGANSEFIAEISGDADTVGRSNVGDFQVAVAVEPHELTDLTYAMKYGDITLAVALPDATPEDERPISTISGLMAGSVFNGVPIEEILELEGAEVVATEGGDSSTDADDTASSAPDFDDEAADS